MARLWEHEMMRDREREKGQIKLEERKRERNELIIGLLIYSGRAKWVYCSNVIFGLSSVEADACNLCG